MMMMIIIILAIIDPLHNEGLCSFLPTVSTTRDLLPLEPFEFYNVFNSFFFGVTSWSIVVSWNPL